MTCIVCNTHHHDFIAVLACDQIDWTELAADFRGWVANEVATLGDEDPADTLRDIIQMDHPLARQYGRIDDIHFAAGMWTSAELHDFIDTCLA